MISGVSCIKLLRAAIWMFGPLSGVCASFIRTLYESASPVRTRKVAMAVSSSFWSTAVSRAFRNGAGGVGVDAGNHDRISVSGIGVVGTPIQAASLAML